METITDHQKKIVQYLSSHHDSYVSIKELAAFLGCSPRTVSNDIKTLKDLNYIISGKRGYSLTSHWYDIADSLPEDISINDRIVLIKKLLIRNDDLSIDELAEQLYCSNTTLQRRIKQLANELSRYGISISIIKNHIAISGSEEQKRKAISHVVYQEVFPNFFSTADYAKYFDGLDINKLNDIVTRIIKNNGCSIQIAYSPNLILNVTIALYRMYNNQHSMPHTNYVSQQLQEQIIAKQICEECYKNFNIDYTNADIDYITSVLYGQIQGDSVCLDKNVMSDFEQQIFTLLKQTLEYYMIQIQYSPYVRSLALHINDLLNRAKAHNYAVCKIYQTIKDTSPFVYEIALSFAKKLDEKYSIHLTLDEIGFLAVHIGLLVENEISEHYTIKILLTTNNYKDTNRRIEQKLFERYGDSITIEKSDSSFIDREKFSNIDLIISDTPISIIGKQTVLISPLFSQIDCSFSINAIDKLLEEKSNVQSSNDIGRYFDKRLFFKTTDITNRDDAIKFLANKMIDLGICDSSFIDSVNAREAASSTCFFNRFAIPHPLNMNAKQTKFSVLINENGIDWDKSKVRLCLLLAIHEQDRKEFSLAYNGAAKILCDKDHFEQLVKANTLDEFISCL